VEGKWEIRSVISNASKFLKGKEVEKGKSLIERKKKNFAQKRDNKSVIFRGKRKELLGGTSTFGENLVTGGYTTRGKEGTSS